MEAWCDEPNALVMRQSPGCEAAFQLCELTRSLTVADAPAAIAALEQAAQAGGADAALFVSVIPGPETAWYRTIGALSPAWNMSALRHLYSDASDWLLHAKRSSEPKLVCTSLCESEDADSSSAIWLIPAPSPLGSDAIGILLLAGRNASQLDPTRRLMPAYRALALELMDWFQRRDRDELVKRAHLTDRDLAMLRLESIGQGSKRIAVALDTEPRTIDCWFHRLNRRLGVPNRREAVRLCQRCGLL